MILFKKFVEDEETIEEKIINFFKNKNRRYKDIRYSVYFDTNKKVPVYTALLIYEVEDRLYEKGFGLTE